MTLELADDTMTVVLNGEVIATGARSECGWHVTTRPHPLDRKAAITALMLAERHVTHGKDDPCAMKWRRGFGHAQSEPGSPATSHLGPWLGFCMPSVPTCPQGSRAAGQQGECRSSEFSSNVYS